MFGLLKKSVYFLLSIISLLITGQALAQSDYGLSATAGAAGLPSTGGLPEAIGLITGAAVALAGSIFLFLMVYGAIMMMISAGDQTKVTKGKDIIKWAIFGAIVLGAAYAITTLVINTLK
jgi:hypothetical protein